MGEWIEFNIHNCATMGVAADAPTAALMKDMFRPFLTRGLNLDHYDVTVTGRFEEISDAAHAETEYRYTETALHINATDVQILLDGDGFRVNGTRELLVTTLPLIDRVLVTRGMAMVHAATVEYRGHGICLPAWGGVGKTSTIAKLLKIDGFAFMGDDWAFLATDGRLLGYAKPMFIKPHHRPIYPHLFKKKRKPLVPVRLSRQLGKVTTMVHPMVTRYPRFAGATRRLSPEHMMVTPQEAFPQARISTSAPLAISIFVERFDGSRTMLQEKDKAWMVSRIVGNFHAEMAQHSREVVSALGATGLVPIERFFSEKAAVIEQGLSDKPTFLMQVPAAWSPDKASDSIVEHLHKAFALTGVA